MITSVTLAGALTFAGLCTPRGVHAEPASGPYVEVRVEVDVSGLEDGSRFEESLAKLADAEVHEVLARELGLREVGVSEGEVESVVRVSLRWEDYEKAHYAVVVEVRRGGQWQLVVRDECETCDEQEVAALVAAKVPMLLPHLEVEATTEPEPVDEGAGPEIGASAEETHEPAEETDEAVLVSGPRRVGIAGYAGIAAAAVGIGVGVWGAVVFGRPPSRSFVAADDSTDEFRGRRPLGMGLMGTGGGLALVGVALIVVDQTVLLRKRRERARSTALVPLVSPAGIGLSWGGRF